MSGPFPLLSSVGATGATQNPGVFGQIGQGLTGLAGILQASQDHMLRQQQVALQSDYQKGQLDHMRALEQQVQQKATIDRLTNQFAGQYIGNISRPDVPVGGGAMPFQFDLPAMSLEAAITQVPPELRPEVAKRTEDTTKRVVGQQAAKRSEAAVNQVLGRLPPQEAEALRATIGLGPDVPAEIRSSVYTAIAGTGKAETKTKIADNLYNSGAISVGQYAAMTGSTLPEGVDPGYKKPRTDQFAQILFRNQVERDLGVPGQTEQDALRNARALIPAMQTLEGGTVALPGRVQLLSMTGPFQTVNEFFKSVADPKIKAWFQASQLFLNPILRDETGAAFGKMEPMTIIDRFIPLADDPPDVKRAKWEARREVASSILGAAGRAASDQERRGTFKPGQFQEWIDYLNAPPGTKSKPAAAANPTTGWVPR